MLKNINGFDWDAGNLSKCKKHGTSITETESIFTKEVAIFPDIEHSLAEKRFIAIGIASTERYVFVAFTLRKLTGTTLIRPISTRFMHKKEIEHYEKEITDTKR